MVKVSLLLFDKDLSNVNVKGKFMPYEGEDIHTIDWDELAS